LGGTYGISVSQTYQKIPNPEYVVAIQFGCDPKRTEDLVTRVFQEVERLKANGPTGTQLNDERQALLKEYEAKIKTNTYLLGQISAKYLNGEDPAGLWLIPDYYQKLDAATIQRAARTYLDTNNVVRVSLFPEKR
jgi:zinc protease